MHRHTRIKKISALNWYRKCHTLYKRYAIWMNADDPMIVVIGYGFVVFFIAGNTTLKNAPLFMIQMCDRMKELRWSQRIAMNKHVIYKMEIERERERGVKRMKQTQCSRRWTYSELFRCESLTFFAFRNKFGIQKDKVTAIFFSNSSSKKLIRIHMVVCHLCYFCLNKLLLFSCHLFTSPPLI